MNQLFQLIILICSTVVFATTLSELFYICSETLFIRFWLIAALFHSLISVLFFKTRGCHQEVVAKKNRRFVGYLPHIFILSTSMLLVILSRVFWPPALVSRISLLTIASVLWIPFVEEFAYRGYFGRYFRRYGGSFYGGYFSAVFFALMHANLRWEGVFQGEIWLPMGPFLLGLVNEFLWSRFASWWMIISFHIVCNMSVLIFSFFDSRWFYWLSYLFIF